ARLPKPLDRSLTSRLDDGSLSTRPSQFCRKSPATRDVPSTVRSARETSNIRSLTSQKLSQAWGLNPSSISKKACAAPWSGIVERSWNIRSVRFRSDPQRPRTVVNRCCISLLTSLPRTILREPTLRRLRYAISLRHSSRPLQHL